MRVVFVYNGSESLGIASLSAFLKAHGHDTFLVFDPAIFGGNRGRENPILQRIFDIPPREIAKKAISYEPDILAFSCVTGNFRWALEVAGEAKKLCQVPTVFGGIHPTAVPERVIREEAVDAIVIGEGEEALLEIVKDTKDGIIRNLAVRNAWIKRNGVIHRNAVRPYIRNLDSLPFPDKSLFYEKVPALEKVYMIMTSRGCPFRCAYCCNNLYSRIYANEKEHVRQRSVDHVLDELHIVKRRGVAEYIAFWDDIFALNKRWLNEFAPRYRREIGIPFVCYLHPNTATEETVKLLKEAGCETVKMGVQTVSEKTLKETLNRKGSPDKVKRAAELLAKYRIKLTIEHIIGLPGEGLEEQDKAAQLYASIEAKKIISFWLTHYPGTEIIKASQRLGLLTKEEADAIESGAPDLNYTFMFPSKKAKNERKNLQKYHTLYDIMPMLPSSLKRFAVRNARYLPFSPLLHQLLIALNAIRNNDREDILGIKYVFSRKEVP